MLGVTGYKTKKELKAAIGQPLRYIETSMFGPEYKDNGTLTVVGPCAFTKRTFFAQVVMKDGRIERVK